MSDLPQATRGERLNNPGNIRWDLHTAWLGQTGHDEDGFCIFDAPVHGIRALCRILMNYQKLDGCKTLGDVISRYAPYTENDVEAYQNDVAERCGLAPDQLIDFTQESELAVVARAIIVHENGRCVYPPEMIALGAAMALSNWRIST